MQEMSQFEIVMDTGSVSENLSPKKHQILYEAVAWNFPLNFA